MKYSNLKLRFISFLFCMKPFSPPPLPQYLLTGRVWDKLVVKYRRVSRLSRRRWQRVSALVNKHVVEYVSIILLLNNIFLSQTFNFQVLVCSLECVLMMNQLRRYLQPLQSIVSFMLT